MGSGSPFSPETGSQTAPHSLPGILPNLPPPSAPPHDTPSTYQDPSTKLGVLTSQDSWNKNKATLGDPFCSWNSAQVTVNIASHFWWHCSCAESWGREGLDAGSWSGEGSVSRLHWALGSSRCTQAQHKNVSPKTQLFSPKGSSLLICLQIYCLTPFGLWVPWGQELCFIHNQSSLFIHYSSTEPDTQWTLNKYLLAE